MEFRILGSVEATGLLERAAVLFGASQAVREAIGAPILGPDLARFQKAVAEVRLALGEGPFTAAERRGRAMSEADAVALARSGPAGVPANDARPCRNGRPDDGVFPA